MNDPIPYHIRDEKTRKVKLYQMKYKQRERLDEKVSRWKDNISKRYNQSKSDRERKKLETEKNAVEDIHKDIKKINQITEKFDTGNRNANYKYDDLLDKPVKNALREIQKSPYEYGGGINIENPEFPEKLVVRKGKPTESHQDYTCDIVLHSHPDRKLKNQVLAEQFLDNIKVKTEKDRSRLERLKAEINAPIDYLPSAVDIINMNDLDKNQTQLILSKNRVAVLTKRDNQYIDSVDKNYPYNLTKIAAVRSFTHDPKDLKDAEKMVANYRKEVRKGFKSFSDHYGLDSEIQSSSYIPYRLPSDNLRQSRKGFVPEKKYVVKSTTKTISAQNHQKRERKPVRKREEKRKKSKQYERKPREQPKGNWFTRLFR